MRDWAKISLDSRATERRRLSTTALQDGGGLRFRRAVRFGGGAMQLIAVLAELMYHLKSNDTKAMRR